MLRVCSVNQLWVLLWAYISGSYHVITESHLTVQVKTLAAGMLPKAPSRDD